MNKTLINILKKIVIIVGITFGILYLAFLILPLVVSSVVNNYSPQITQEIQKATGLNSKLEGVKLVTTPKLTVGLKVDKFALLTPDNKDILNSEDFQVKMSLLPLFAKKIEVDVIQLDKLDVKLGLNKDGSFEIEKYLPKAEPTEEKPKNTEPFVLPLGLKLSNHLPDIRIGGYEITFIDLSNGKTYVIKGNKTEVTDFVLNKSVKLVADGNITLQGREQFVYDIKINNKIMPDLDLNELVFNPEQKKETKKEEVKINVLDILKEIYKNQITANLKTDITTKKTNEHLNFHGDATLDNLSVAPSGLKLPPSDINLKFAGEKIDINSNLYTAQNEVSTITGALKTGKKPDIDMNFKSGAELSNILKIAKAFALTFNIKDLQTLNANGKIDANFNIKSDFKKINSNGYFKIPNAKIFYGLYNVGIDNIKTDIALNNNNININNLSFSILGQPLRLYGLIKEDATADLHLLAESLNLKGLLVACGQAALLKENPVNSGIISVTVDVTGKLDKIQPAAKVTLSNIDMKNTPSNTGLKLPKTYLDVTTDGEGFSGVLKSTDIKVINPAASVSIPSFNANINENVIEIANTPIKVENINFVLSGKIKDYLKEKMIVDLKTTGDINSTLTGDVNSYKQTLNLNFTAPNNNTIVIPMFNKSKMVFKGNLGITGLMFDPMLSGTFNIPSISIPEIPVVMDNTDVKLNGKILNGKATVGKFASGGIVAENLSTDFAMKGVDFYLNNVKGQAFDGNIAGNIIYNMSNAKTTVDFSGTGMNAEKTVAGAVGIKNALSGTLSFNTKLTLLALDYDKMMKSLNGNLDFKIQNGAFGKIGRIENLLSANNVMANTVLKTTVATLSTLSPIKNSAKYDYISGDLTFSNGWANIKDIKSTGQTLAYYITGKYNLLNGTTNVVLLGRMDASLVALLGPMGDLSVSKLLAYIPKFGATTAAIANSMTRNPKLENIAAIPALSNGSKSYKDFKVEFNGGLESKSSVKSFRWLTTVDTSAIEKVNAVDTVKTLKTSVDTDVQNAVTKAKETAEKIKTQQQLLKNSAQEIKNLLKF
ncbi:MAG: hypothetical protein MJ231_00690 [bacterium]|nr:hypothetical protein [bacterium]